ncbi:FIG00650156: hypothetical protein [hydrothermal vent metagenome]|uniref:Periplasmic nitrate reductase component NapL n=1 Tax=hydrothermal vent metagenome TaxID=652676 RepID=A0A3B0QY93_9ZZZZ
MKFIKFFILLLSSSVIAQVTVTAKFIKKEALKVDKVVDVDNFGTTYYINNSTFYLQVKNKTINYSNVQLGKITSANTFNPLKINLFYKDFNSVIVLDNRLAEIVKVDFNFLQPFRNLTHISTANNNAIWLFDQNTQQLELFDYLSRKTISKTLPIDDTIIDITSNYNFCWLMSSTFIYAYNYFGSLIYKIPNNGYTSIKVSHENLFLLKENQLFYKAKNTNKVEAIKLPQLLINQFLVTNETLYIYDHEFLYQYQLITN